MDTSEFTNLDNAATSFPKPPEMVRAVEYYLTKNGSGYGREQSPAALETARIFSETRRLLAEMFGAHRAERICFTPSCTDALNTALFGVLKRGDEVLSSVLEHNALLRPLRFLQKTRKIKVKLLVPDENGHITPDKIQKQLSASTRLVALTGMSNVQGIPQPLQEIGKRIKEHSSAKFLVDGAQLAGQHPVNLTESLIDIFCFTAHKALLSPPGLGGICLSPDTELTPRRLGDTAFARSNDNGPAGYPDMLEAGTQNIPAVFGLNAALRYLNQYEKENGSLYEHQKKLSTRLLEELRLIKGLEVHIPKNTREVYGAVAVSINGLEAKDLAFILQETYSVLTRAGQQSAPLLHKWMGTASRGVVRLSPGHFNTEGDVIRAVRALQSIVMAAGQT